MSYSKSSSFGKGATVLASFAFVLLAWAPSARAQEERCVELGSNCGCSEPLAATGWTTLSSPSITDKYLNPNDSQPGSGKECDGEAGTGHTWYRGYNPYPVPVPETGMPAGNTVDRVWRVSGGGQLMGQSRSNPIPSSARRVCVRHYFKLSMDWDGAGQGSCDGSKVIQLVQPLHVGDGGSSDQWNYGINGLFSQVPVGINGPKTGVLRWDDCRENWCRVEICESGNLSAGTDLYTEGYMQQVTGGSTRMDFHRIFLGNGPTPLTSNYAFFWPANMYRQGTCRGSRDIAFAMQASWDTDAGQFIGSAYEIEGGTPGAPPPDPTPTPDPGPTPDPVDLTLDLSVSVNGTDATVTSTVQGGVGPYQFLFDCGADGGWDGVVDTSDVVAEYTCSLGATPLDIQVLVWDRGSGTQEQQIVVADPGTAPPASLGQPGQPVLVISQ